MTNHGLTVGRSCPKPGGNPIEDYDEDYDEDEVERLVEVDENLVADYLFAQDEYVQAYASYQEKKFIRDSLKGRVVEALQSETGTATVGGNRKLSVKVTKPFRVDVKRLKAEAPDIAIMYEKESFSSRIDVI